MKKFPLLMTALASSIVLLSGCGQKEQPAETNQAPAEQAAAPAPAEAPKPSAVESAMSDIQKAAEKVETTVSKAAESAKTAAADAVHQVQGAMTAAQEPQQPKAPELGAKVYGQCVGCHGPQGGGGVGPKLAGQSADALKEKLHAYKAGKQVGPQTAMMAPMVQGLSDEEIDAVANYIATHFK